MNASFVVVLTVIETALGFMAGGLIGGFPDIIKFITYIIQYFILIYHIFIVIDFTLYIFYFKKILL